MTESLPSLRDIRMDGKRLRWWVNADGETCLLREDSAEWFSVVGRVYRGERGGYYGVSPLLRPNCTLSSTTLPFAAERFLNALLSTGILLPGVKVDDL